MKTAHAILIDPTDMCIKYVDIDLYKGKQFDDGVESIKKYLDCHYFESAPSLFSKTASLVAEIDYLNKDQSEYDTWLCPDHILGTITGNCLIVGVGSEGQLSDIDCSLEAVAELVRPKMELIYDHH